MILVSTYSLRIAVVHSPDIDFWVCASYFNLLPAEFLAAAVGLVPLISNSHILLLFLAQEVGVSWVVWETKEHNYSADNTEQTLDNIDPSAPMSETTHCTKGLLTNLQPA